MKKAFYRNGMLYDVYPRNLAISLYEDRQVAYDADIVVSDGVEYNITTLEGIQALSTPDFSATGDILELSYILKMRCGVIVDQNLVPIFIDKVLQLMRASKMLWSARDYLQVIRNYYRVGLFADGDAFEATYRQEYPELFSCANFDRVELEHTRTKAYFKRKWEKKHG